MDRSWINYRRTSDEYENGVEYFLQFAKTNLPSSSEKFHCPLDMDCLNEIRLDTELIREHLLCDGFLKSYTIWIWHGERYNMPTTSSHTEDVAERNHWQLFVLCPKQNLIVFFCSLGNKPKTNVKSVFDMAMQAHQITKNRRNSKPRWIKPISRMQKGTYESGYYVMRHMETIISAVVVDSWIETFNVQESFSPQDITETREHWASFVCDNTSSTGCY